jgi:hypothetical protein
MVKVSGVLASVDVTGGLAIPASPGGGQNPGSGGRVTSSVPLGLTNVLHLAQGSPSLVITRPVADFKWYMYSTQKVLWELQSSFPAYIGLTLELRHTSRGLVSVLGTNINPALQSFSFTPTKFAPGDGFFFRLKDTASQFVYYDTAVFCIANGVGSCP